MGLSLSNCLHPYTVRSDPLCAPVSKQSLALHPYTLRTPPQGGGIAIKAMEVCRLVPPGVRTGLCFYNFTIELFALLVPFHWGTAFSVGVSGIVLPLLTSAASAPWRPSHAGAGDASHSVIPETVNIGGRSPLLRKM